MQQTKFDQWLKMRFIYETHIFTLRVPEEKLPRGVKVITLDAQRKSGDYRYKLRIKSQRVADKVIDQLKSNHVMYATRVVEGRHLYNRFLAPEGKSFTLQWILRFLGVCCFLSLGWFLFQLSENTELIKIIEETIQDLKG